MSDIIDRRRTYDDIMSDIIDRRRTLLTADIPYWPPTPYSIKKCYIIPAVFHFYIIELVPKEVEQGRVRGIQRYII